MIELQIFLSLTVPDPCLYHTIRSILFDLYFLVISCLFMLLLDHSQAAESNNSFFLRIVGSKMFKLYPSRDFTMNKK